MYLPHGQRNLSRSPIPGVSWRTSSSERIFTRDLHGHLRHYHFENVLSHRSFATCPPAPMTLSSNFHRNFSVGTCKSWQSFVSIIQNASSFCFTTFFASFSRCFSNFKVWGTDEVLWHVVKTPLHVNTVVENDHYIFPKSHCCQMCDKQDIVAISSPVGPRWGLESFRHTNYHETIYQCITWKTSLTLFLVIPTAEHSVNNGEICDSVHTKYI